MPNTNKEEKSPDKIYASIQVDKDTSKALSFRVDGEIYKKIKTLEDVRKESTSQVLKNAVENSFNNMIFSFINNNIFLILNEIYESVEIISTNLTMMTGNNKDEEKLPFTQKENELHCRSTVTYSLNYGNYEDKDGSLYSLDALRIKMNTEGNNLLNLKIVLGNVIDGQSEKINPNLYLKVAQIVGKTDFTTEMNPSKKGHISTDITFERKVNYEFDKWSKMFKNELIEFKQMMDELNKTFNENKNLTKKKRIE